MLVNQQRTRILNWQSEGLISSSNLEAAFEATKSDPAPLDWQHFLLQIFLWLGAIAISTGVVFFFAYNWQDISRLSKFTLVESIFFIATLLFHRFARKQNVATVILFANTILTGSLLALVGQTYQTGADPWQLFAVWVLFITPWVAISNTTPLWFFWVLLINLSLLSYFTVSASFWGMLLTQESGTRLFVLLNSLLLIAFEWNNRRSKKNAVNQMTTRNYMFHSKRVCQLLVVLAGVAISSLALDTIFGSKKITLDLLFYIAWGGLVYYYYRYKSRDLFIIAAGTLSVCIMLISALVDFFGASFKLSFFLLIGFAIVVLSTSTGIWLKSLAKEFSRLDNPVKTKPNKSAAPDPPDPKENNPPGDH